MQSLSSFWAQHKSLFCFIAFLLLVLGIPSFTATKFESFLWLNQHHDATTEQFFTLFTWLGDGQFSIIVVLLLLLYRKIWMALQLLATYLLSGGIAQLIKKIIAAPRPKACIASNLYHHFIDGVTHSGSNSFPSGHTTSAFAMAFILACNTRNHLLQILYFVVAVTIGFSRIYLGQHFLMDVFGGMIVGVCTSAIICLTLTPRVFARNRALQGNPAVLPA